MVLPVPKNRFLKMLTNKIIYVVLCQIEELGSEGRVEEAQGMMKLVEQLKEEREQLSSTPSVSLKCLTAALASTASVFRHGWPCSQCSHIFSQDLQQTLDSEQSILFFKHVDN